MSLSVSSMCFYTGIFDVKPVYIFTCNDDIR